MDLKAKKIRLQVSEKIGAISALVMMPREVRSVLVLAHGAGAGMEHRFMESLAAALGQKAIGTVRYNFPYMEKGSKRPDPPAIAHKAVSVVIQNAVEMFPQLPLFAGGKSFGGRMTSQWLAKNAAPFVKGIVFFGFPLHPAGQPSAERAEHLHEIDIPMLFLQGTRDSLADNQLIKDVCSGLPTAALKQFDGADHSFKSGKREYIPELAEAASQWILR